MEEIDVRLNSRIDSNFKWMLITSLYLKLSIFLKTENHFKGVIHIYKICYSSVTK